MKILILGHNGMLGGAVTRILPEADTCPYRYPSPEFKEFVQTYDFIINCIGRIPQRKNKDFSLNSHLPIYLERFTKARIIHPSSDCENDDTEYGISKRAATDWICAYGERTKIIQCSIIGIDREKASLLSWVLAQAGPIPGYVNARWSGITSIKWARIAKDMILNWDIYNQREIYHTYPTTKYELIKSICRIFGKDNEVFEVEKGEDKVMLGSYVGTIEKQLEEIYGLR